MLYFYEDKGQIINALFQVLKMTVAGVDLAEIEYRQLANGDELAILIYDNGYRKPVNISCDSGVTMLRDILRAID